MPENVDSIDYLQWMGGSANDSFRFEELSLESASGVDCVVPDGWAKEFWCELREIANKSKLVPLTAEIALISEQVMNTKPSFTSNFVIGPGLNKDRIAKAYEEAISRVDRNGSVIGDKCFHEQFCIISQASRSPESDMTEFSSEISVVRRSVHHLVDTKMSIEEVRENCLSFFTTFLDGLAPAYGNFAQCWYMAVPFQKPALEPGGFSQQSMTLVPAGAIFITLIHNEVLATEEATDSIVDFATRIRSKIQDSHLMFFHRRVADEIAKEERLKQSLTAYDSIGHSLRAFVEVTGYRGAVAMLEHVQSNAQLSSEMMKMLSRCKRSLAFFEHAEALGSLMRLHGWVEQSSSARYGKLVAEKISNCFLQDDVPRVLAGELGDEILTGYADICSRIAIMLSSKDSVPFSIERFSGREQSHVVLHDPFDVSDQLSWIENVFLPPLVSTGDSSAVLLAIAVAILEPMRNASTYLKSQKKREGNPSVQIILKLRERGEVTLYVGNPLFGGDQSDFTANVASLGVVLVGNLLRDCRLGEIRKPTKEEFKSLPRQPGFECSELEYLWLCVELRPLDLFYSVQTNYAVIN